MGWSGSCEKHPSVSRSPGVCPSCLRERLSLLSHSQPYHYASSGGASPARGRRHLRNASEANYSVNKTSSSVAFAPRSYSHRFGIYELNQNNNNNVNEKKTGFWSKLISGKRNKKTTLPHVDPVKLRFRRTLDSAII